MRFFNRLFKKQTPLLQDVLPGDKQSRPVYPVIKHGQWKTLPYAKFYPFVETAGSTELAIAFAQAGEEKFFYITDEDLHDPLVKENFQKWQQNIDEYPFEIELSAELDNRVVFASGEDHSSEKILSAAFLGKVAEILGTDSLLISIPRRRNLMITSYHENFQLLETFFHLHFQAWREEDYGNEPITEMVFIASPSQLEYAVPLGFRMNLYEKNGKRTLSYSTMDDLFDEDDRINFQNIMNRNKIPVRLPR